MAEGLRYRSILELGRGGMAEVSLAYGQGPGGFGKLVVLKSMLKELVAEEELRELFLAEARLCARLNHPNVVQVYEVLDSAIPAIVMEYLEGQPLSGVICAAKGGMPLTMHLRILSEALAGLHYSHEFRDFDGSPLNIVHRDVSPQNTFVTYDGSVKVLDFGIAKVASAPSQTQTGIVKGKLSYMPREQLLNEPLDRRADVYAMGCMLWEAATGLRLWGNLTEGVIMRRLMEGDLPSATSVRPVDPALAAIIAKAMAQSPSDRYSTAREMQKELDQFLLSSGPVFSLREVGEYVGTLFAEERKKLGRTIHLALQSPDSLSSNSKLSEIRSGTLDTSLPSRTGVPVSTPSSLRPGAVVYGVAIVLVLMLIVVGRRWYDLQTLAATEAAGRSADRASVRLNVTVLPEAARIFLDGVELSGNPVTAIRTLDKQQHRLSAMALGYAAEERNIQLVQDQSIEIVLRKQSVEGLAPSASSPAEGASSLPPTPALSAEPRGAKSHGSRGGGHAGAAPNQAKRSRNCDPPFYFNNGIKVYKNDCI